MNIGNAAPTNATQTKERLYTQLAGSFGRMSCSISRTADLCEQLQVDLHAMRVFAGLDAAKFMTVANEMNPDPEEDEGKSVVEGASEAQGMVRSSSSFKSSADE